MRYRGRFGDMSCTVDAHHVDDSEFAEFHDHIAFAMRSLGLRGVALDEALSAAAALGLRIAERERTHDKKRRSTIAEIVT
jgi:hypothetical protein